MIFIVTDSSFLQLSSVRFSEKQRETSVYRAKLPSSFICISLRDILILYFTKYLDYQHILMDSTTLQVFVFAGQ